MSIWKQHSTWIDLFIITFIWCLAVYLVNPMGDFPVNDDWAYAKSVKILLEDQEFSQNWGVMTLFSQILWGALFCKIFGYSFTVLRFSTLTLSLIGFLSFYILLRHMESTRKIAIFAALLLAFNPVLFPLAFSFMSDVPHVIFCILALLFFFKNLEYDSGRDYFLAIFFTVVAVLSRQVAIFVPLAYGFACLITRKFGAKPFVRAVLPFAVAVLTYAIYIIVLNPSLTVHSGFGKAETRLLRTLIDMFQKPEVRDLFFFNANVAFIYIGLFLFPLLLLHPTPNTRREIIIGSIWSLFFLMIILFSSNLINELNRIMPLSENTIVPTGVGPVILKDTVHYKTLIFDHLERFPVTFWAAVTTIGIVGASLLAGNFIYAIYRYVTRLKSRHGLFFFFAAIIYLAPFTLHGFYDRYLLPVVPVFIAGFIPVFTDSQEAFSTWKKAVSGAVMGFMILFSIAATHDFMSFNRARWTALNWLTEEKDVPPEKIDGGFEFNGLYTFIPNYKANLEKSWWWVKDDTYALTLGPLDGYRIYKSFTYNRYIPPFRKEVYILKKSGNS